MNFYANEIDENSNPIGERHGPYGTEAEATEVAERLQMEEAERRILNKLSDPGSQEPLIRFGVFSEG